MYQARLGEYLLISRGLQLPSDSTCILEAEPGELDIKRHSFTLQNSEYDVMIDFFVSIQRHWRRHLKSETS